VGWVNRRGWAGILERTLAIVSDWMRTAAVWKGSLRGVVHAWIERL